MVEHEIFFSKTRETALDYSDKTLKIKEYDESSGYGIRVIKNNKIGFAYCQSKDGIKSAIERAAILSRHTMKSKFSFQRKNKYPRVKTVDKKIENMDEKDLKDIIYGMKSGAEKYTKKCRISGSYFSEGLILENTEGLDAGYRKTGMELYVEAMKGKGFGYSYYAGISPNKNPEELGRIAGKMAKDMEKPSKPKSGVYNIVLSAPAFSSIFGILTPSFSGDLKRRKITKLVKNKKMLDPKLSIYDNPMTGQSATNPFDDEGTPSKKTALIEKGVVKEFFYDRETAALEKIKKDGFCTRADFSTPPGISHSNIIVKPGNYDIDELDEYLFVESLFGTHTSNFTTGDFGVEVNVAFHIKKGKKTPVRGFMISDNVFNLFNRIIGIERKAIDYDYLNYPRIAFGEAKVIS